MNKKKLLGVVLGAAVALGGVGAGASVIASAADGNVVYANGYVYTEEQRIVYEEGNCYELEVKLSSDTGISGFQMKFDMPHFAEIMEVRENEGVFHYTQYMQDGNHSFLINGMSDEDKTEALLFTVVYTLSEDAGSFMPDAVLQQFTNTDFKYVEGLQASFAEVIVETQQITRLKGDMNEDGTVDLEDLLIIQRSLIDPNYPLNGWQTEYADINGDAQVDLLDCQYVQMYIVGRLNSLENVGSGDDTNPDTGGENPGDTTNPDTGGENPGDTTDPGAGTDPAESFVTYTLVVNNQTTQHSLFIEEGDTVVKFMETYKVYDGVAYSEVLVYLEDASGTATALQAETPFVIGAHYRVVLTGGTQAGGGETEAKITIFVQQRIDGVKQEGRITKEFNAGDTIGMLREACVMDGYIVEGIFLDEGYDVQITESEAAALPLEEGKTYYVSFGSIVMPEPLEPTIYLTVTVDGAIKVEQQPYMINEGATVATVRDAYKVYENKTYNDVRVYGYTNDGAMVQLASEAVLTAGASYRVVLAQIANDVVGDNKTVVGAYTYAKNVEEVLQLNEDGSFVMSYQGKQIQGSQYTATVDASSMRAEATLYSNEGVEYRATLNLVDLTFTI